MEKNWFKDKDKIREKIERVLEDRRYGNTYSFHLLNDGTNTWGLVFGWRDGKDFDRKHDVLCGYLGYLPNNSIMREFGYDWMMPYDKESGEVDDTELTIEDISDLDLDWWEDNWYRMINEYKLVG